MTERVAVWRCIGCGRIEAPQPCIGVCQDRKEEFVYATEHDQVLRRLALARSQVKTLEALVRRFASTTPREGEWEHSYRVLQHQARRALAMVVSDAPMLERSAPADGGTGAT